MENNNDGDGDGEKPSSAVTVQISQDAQDHIQRTGTMWTAIAHVITGVIGAGVLSLAWSIAQLGWIAGPLAIVIFAGIIQVSINLVCDCYRSPDPCYGPERHRSFIEAVRFYLGKKRQMVCGVFLLQSFYGCGIAYTIATASSVNAILQSNCYHDRGHDANCSYGTDMFMLMFGFIQIIVSQIPDFHNMAWLSVVAAVMSFCYAGVGFGLGFATVVGNKEIKGTLGGVVGETTTDKVMLVFQGIADIAFAFPYSQILLEIEDTLKSPPPENQTMKKASMVSLIITTVFYLCCGCFGYAAFGNTTPGNLLTGFGFYEPYWLVDFSNACIILHLVGGYQMYTQPVFAFVEGRIAKKFPKSKLVQKTFTCKIPFVAEFQLNLLRLVFRTSYVVSTTAIAMLFPYFNLVLGVSGAMTFWPIALYFPVEMYLAQSKTKVWTKRWFMFQSLSMFGLVLSVVGLTGSVVGLMKAKFHEK